MKYGLIFMVDLLKQFAGSRFGRLFLPANSMGTILVIIKKINKSNADEVLPNTGYLIFLATKKHPKFLSIAFDAAYPASFLLLLFITFITLVG